LFRFDDNIFLSGSQDNTFSPKAQEVSTKNFEIVGIRDDFMDLAAS
jgi:hypothetical protein